MKDNALALIAARPGRMRVSLQALLAAMPEIEKIELADDDAMALELVAKEAPAVVLLDTNLPGKDGVWAVLEQIKTQWSQVRCLVMADDNRQEQAAQDAGADEVLLKGFPTLELFVAVERLLSEDDDCVCQLSPQADAVVAGGPGAQA